jgi:polyisoprenoid-binding protein YceI
LQSVPSTGTVSFDPDSIEESCVELATKVKSLDLLDEVRSNERREIERVMFDEVLESGRYPVIEFKSSRASGIKTGEKFAGRPAVTWKQPVDAA